MGTLSKLPNIGGVLESRLNHIGITEPAELFELGSKQAFIRLRQKNAGACLSTLCALEGAIEGIRWHSLPSTVKTELKAFYKNLS